MTERLTGSPEPCTRLGAVDAGWRLAERQRGLVLVLQHSGAEGNRWQLRGSCVELGAAVATFKARRQHVVSGAVALWHAGRVTRYETAADLVTISFKAG